MANYVSKYSGSQIDTGLDKAYEITSDVGQINNSKFTTLQLIQSLRQVMNSVNNLIVEKKTVTLTNTLRYPFNDSKITVALDTIKNSTDYTVFVEVVSYTGGGYGDIEITEKLSNGFKIAFTGGATSVIINLYIRGGMEKKGVF